MTVPDGAETGSRLRISLPGIEEKVIVTVPDGATPGRSMSFTLKGLPDAKEAGAACKLQAVHRGKMSRTTYEPKGHAAPPYDLPAATSRTVYTPRGAAAAGAAAPSDTPGKPTHDPALYPSLSPSHVPDEPEPEADESAPALAPSDRSPMLESVVSLGSAIGGGAAASVSTVGRGLTRMATAGVSLLSEGGGGARPDAASEAAKEQQRLDRERLAWLASQEPTQGS